MPISQRKLAKHWGVTQPRVAQLVKEGCPTTSFKIADRWRESRGLKRAPTNSTANLQFNPKRRNRRLKIPRASKTGDSLLDALNNSINVERSVFKDYEWACIHEPMTRFMYLGDYCKALDARLKSEKKYRKEKARRDLLVNRQAVVDMCRRCIEAVIRELKKLPSEVGPLCNPENPQVAVRILERSVAQIIAAGENAMLELDAPMNGTCRWRH